MPAPISFHYARLGLSPGASRAQLSAAYRAAALKYHPDCGGDGAAFAAIRESYDAILATPLGGYTPASLRSFRQDAARDWEGIWGIMGAVVLPSAVGLGVGIRLMYTGSERSGLRAGGTSRVVVRDDRASVAASAGRRRDGGVGAVGHGKAEA